MAETRKPAKSPYALLRACGRAALQWTRDVLSASRILRLPLVISLVASAVLMFPPQTLELYRVLVQNAYVFSKWFDKFGAFGKQPAWNDFAFFALTAATSPEIDFGFAGLLIMALCIWYMAHRLAELLGDGVPAGSRTGAAMLFFGPSLLGALPFFAVVKGLYDAGAYENIDQARLITDLQNLGDQKQADGVSELLFSFNQIKNLSHFAAGTNAVLGACILAVTLILAQRLRVRKATVAISFPEVIACWSFFIATAAAIILFPVEFPQTVGILCITGLFFAGLALISTQLNAWAERARVPIIIPLVLAALGFSAFDLNDNHLIGSLARDGSSKTVTQFRNADIFKLPTAREEFAKWYQNRPDQEDYQGKKYPVYVVAAQGGGIYAAAHLVLFMTLMQEACPKFAHHTFAISSVSGGSIGAAWFASLARKYIPNIRTQCAPVGDLGADNPTDMYKNARKLLETDYLSPLIGGALIPDFLQRFLPRPFPGLSRARAFELSLQDAWKHTAAARDDEIKNPLASPFLEIWDPSLSVPALVLNTTEVWSGRRRIIAPFIFATSDADSDDFTFLPISQDNDISLSTAVSLSARFPWIAPAGWFNEENAGEFRKIRLADGGYFDNSGVATAIDLIDNLNQITTAGCNKKILISVSISMSNERNLSCLPVEISLIVLTTGSHAVQKFFGFGEALSPIQSLLNARGASTSLTIRRASNLLDSSSRADTGEQGLAGVSIERLLRVHVDDFVFPLPLGWRLSSKTAQLIEMQSGHSTHCVPDDRFKQSTDVPLSYFDGDCVQSLIYHELAGHDVPEALRAAKSARRGLSPFELCAYNLKPAPDFYQETNVTFNNDTDAPKKLYYLDSDGHAEDYGEIAAREKRPQRTSFSHPWMVTDEDFNDPALAEFRHRECFGVFVPPPGLEEISLGIEQKHVLTAPHERCSYASALRSVRGSSPIHVVFVNETDSPKSIFWLNYEGKPEFWRRIGPGESFPQDTYMTHPWMVQDEAGQCVGVYLPTSTQTKFKLSSPR
jgi:hypothetical protein